MNHANDSELFRRLRDIVDETDASGERRYRREDLYVAITHLAIQSGEDLTTLGSALTQIVAQVAEAAGVREDSTADEVTERMRRFFERNPPRPDLLTRLYGACRDINAAATADGHLSSKLAELVGAQGTAKRISTAPRPANSTPAGPMARFALQARAVEPGSTAGSAGPDGRLSVEKGKKSS